MHLLTFGEWSYLAAWMDLFSRRIVRWQIGEMMQNEMLILLLRNTLQLRQPAAGLITHPDRGGQYVSADLKELMHLWHIRPKKSRADNTYDNTFAESLWSRLKTG